MVARKSASFLVLKENTGDTADSERIMVAVGSKFTAVEFRKKAKLAVDRLKFGILPHSRIAHLCIQLRIVVTDHVDIEKVSDLCQRHHRMLGKEGGTAKVGILSRESNEIHVKYRSVPRIMLSQRDNRGCTGCAVNT